MERVAVVFDNFGNAMDVHMKLFELVRKYGCVSWREFSKIVAPNDDIFKCEKYDEYGWDYLCDVSVDPYKDDQWIILMPEMKKLNDKVKEK